MALCKSCWVEFRCLQLREQAREWKMQRIPCLAAPLELMAIELEALGWKQCTCKKPDPT